MPCDCKGNGGFKFRPRSMSGTTSTPRPSPGQSLGKALIVGAVTAAVLAGITKLAKGATRPGSTSG